MSLKVYTFSYTEEDLHTHIQKTSAGIMGGVPNRVEKKEKSKIDI